MIDRRDRAALLLAAGHAADALELRCETTAPTVTLATDELREIAEQFARCVALLTVQHLAAADRPSLPLSAPIQERHA